MHELIARADHIIFDIGNVLLSFQPQWILDRMVPRDLHALFLRSVFGSPLWLRLDLGTLDYHDAARMMCGQESALAPHHDLVLELLHGFPAVMKPLPPVQLMQPLRAMGKKIYLLSNFHRQSYETVLQHHRFLGEVDGAVISCYEQCIKPGARIYNRLLTRFGIDRAKAVFLDDMHDNVRTARRLGIPAIHYDGCSEL